MFPTYDMFKHLYDNDHGQMHDCVDRFSKLEYKGQGFSYLRFYSVIAELSSKIWTKTNIYFMIFSFSCH